MILDTARESFVFAIRNTATYERVYYGRDGKLRRAYLRSLGVAHVFSSRTLDFAGEILAATGRRGGPPSRVSAWASAWTRR